MITLGRVKGTDRWEIQSYIFRKERFKDRESVRKWLEKHLKSEIQLLLDFKAWNEMRKRLLQAFLHIARVP
jgi:protein involved in sex pheromone biosynthesis